MGKKVPILYKDKAQCCGCELCSALCPQHAISMQIDEEGFYYPVIDSPKCTGCSNCIRVCVFKKDQIRMQIQV